jgi:NCAIR mutase (PurE)-related protein
MDDIRSLLSAIKNGDLGIEEGIQRLEERYFKDLGFAKVDTMREKRVGYPEVIYCAGKTPEQIKSIMEYMYHRGSNILATRATEEIFEEVKQIDSTAVFNPVARTIAIERDPVPKTSTYIAIVTAGTSDLPIAEEAAVTAQLYGNKVERINDVGIAGIHRLFGRIDTIRNARVVVVAAGMEGALASVVAGLVDKPVIAIPTSVGYGANFGGLAALLGMLNSCAGGVSVVNIDNGFGAGYLASMINKL